MKNSKKQKEKFFTYQNNFFLFIIFGFIFLTIGYASINSILMDITGRAAAKKAENIYILNANIVSNVDADISVSNPTYQKKFFQDAIVLSNTNKSSLVTYKIIVYNGSNYDVLFEDIYHEAILEMYLNDNEDIIMEVAYDNDNVIEAGTTKDFYVTFKYREDLESIVDNSVNVALNFQIKEITYITYVGFEDTREYPPVVLEGEDLSITFGSDIDYIILTKNKSMLTRGKDFNFDNHTLTYNCISGGTLEINAENNHPISEDFSDEEIIPNTPFIITGDNFYTYNANLSTIYFEVDLSRITTLDSKDNIISIGTEINTFTPTKTNGVNLHFYYPDSSGRMIISPIAKNINGHMQFTVSLDTNSHILKCAINSNGVYCNGNRLISSEGIHASSVNRLSNYTTLTEAEYLAAFFTQFSNELQIKIGSIEGDNRSNAIYNDIIIFDTKLTDLEMKSITEIKEEIRTDFNVIELLDPNNPIIKNQSFKLLEGENFNISNETLIVEMDVSSVIYTNENILSLGKNIGDWFPLTAGDVHLHFFYSPNKNIIAAPLIKGQPVKQYLKNITLIDNKYIKIAFSKNGVYVNGEKMFDKYSVGSGITYVDGKPLGNETNHLARFFEPWLAGNYNIDIGSTQGDARSNAEYIKFEIYDISMTPKELVYYTK